MNVECLIFKRFLFIYAISSYRVSTLILISDEKLLLFKMQVYNFTSGFMLFESLGKTDKIVMIPTYAFCRIIYQFSLITG